MKSLSCRRDYWKGTQRQKCMYVSQRTITCIGYSINASLADYFT